MKKPVSVSQNQQGFASLVIALTLIVVMALITVGFAQLSRREQQQALNKHLAVQANYAAESAVNDAAEDIANKVAPPQQTDCSPYTAGNLKDNVLNSNQAVSYTCVLLNQQPPDLLYGSVGVGVGHTVQVIDANVGATFKTIKVEWTSNDGAHGFYKSTGSKPIFFPQSVWSNSTPPNTAHAPVVEFSITPLNNSGPGPAIGFDRTSLITNSFTAFLYPCDADAGPCNEYINVRDSAAQGETAGFCQPLNAHQAYNCGALFNDLPYKSNKLLFHFQDYYDESNIRISGTDTTATGVAYFEGGQAIVDATGKAQDVSKRVQVRIPLDDSTSTFPYESIQVGSICKRLSLTTTDAQVISPSDYLASVPGNTACNPF